MTAERSSVLVIGVGSIGERHLRCFQATGRADVAFVELNEGLRSTIAQRYGVAGFANMESALSKSGMSTSTSTGLGLGLGMAKKRPVAVVATPANTHIAIATQLVEAGFNVLIEKPLSTCMTVVEELQQLVRDRSAVVGVAYVFRSFPSLAQMRTALHSGRFGKPVEIVVTSGQHFPTYRPAYRDTYYTDRASGGGAIQDALTHLLNAGEWLVGRIDRLVADAAHRVLEGVTVEDTVHVLTRHDDVLGSYSLNQHQAPNETTITVVCQRGTVRWESHTQQWRWVARPDEPWYIEPQEPLARDASFIAQANRFLDAADRTAPPVCSLADGVQTLRVNLAALASVQSGQWQTV